MKTSIALWAKTMTATALLAGAGAAQAITMTLPTTLIDAEATFNFSETASTLMGNMGVSVSALGNTVQGANGWSFMMPVTEVTLKASIFPMGLTPLAGEAIGSSLLIQGRKGALALSNFEMDFTRNIMKADLTTAAGTIKSSDIFSFNVAKGLHVSTTGGLSMDMSLTNMTLTSGAQDAFISALKLPSFMTATLPLLDFGTLDVEISPSLRFGVSAKPFVTAVPEASSVAMLALGLVGIALVSRRKLTQ
ncbi:MAG: PEP-CTERM sorting domain-containing protein [Aquabacterium sp.]